MLLSLLGTSETWRAVFHVSQIVIFLAKKLLSHSRSLLKQLQWLCVNTVVTVSLNQPISKEEPDATVVESNIRKVSVTSEAL